MPLIPDRETNEWIDLADSLCQMEQSFAYKQLLAWLEANRDHECWDMNDVSGSHIKNSSNDERNYLIGLSTGYSRALKAIPELRTHCESQATRDRKKEKKNAAREDSRERTGREEYR